MSLRVISLLALSAGVLTSCTTAPYQETRSPRATQELAEALGGRVAQPAIRCLPNYRNSRMEVIDDFTILYREGRNLYVQNPRGGCRGLRNGSYTLVNRHYALNRLCDGDISQLVDLRSGMGGGACVFGPFVPYTRR